ncbi:MAG TPA: PhzF family phenazine biosynthesis protein [Vicinamibacterales bacterium]|jgi:trans-2,3-dihydro-3-hydroxyanthranilate isomerase|nr:PhzF family phenazine biosynthesis protein [Vicinamibacterales bacterium]
MRHLTRRDFGRATLASLAAAPVRLPGFRPYDWSNDRPGYLPVLADRKYAYLHLDVFTEHPFEGNQLLVFPQPAGLSADAMLTLTRESNYSECTFVFPPDQAGVDHRVRIFTRNAETPFAGHPTIGTAFALASTGAIRAGTARTVFGLGVGPTPIDLEWEGPRLKFAWMTQLKPTFGKPVSDMGALAAAIGVDPAALAGQRAPAQEVSTGSTFLIIPVSTRKAVDSAVLDRARVDAVLTAAGVPRRGLYIFSTEKGSDDADVYSRLLGTGGIEDPATGSAAGPAACFIVRYGFVPASRARQMVFLQGVLVHRPSRLYASVTVAPDTQIANIRVGGAAVVVGEGSVAVP